MARDKENTGEVAGQIELYLLTGRESLLKERNALKTIARALQPYTASRGFPVRKEPDMIAHPNI